MRHLASIRHGRCWPRPARRFVSPSDTVVYIFRFDALALSVIATATWLAGWLGGCLSQPVLYQNENFLDHLVGLSLKHLGPLTPIPNSTRNPFIGGVKYTGGVKIGDFCAIFDIHRRLSRKRCEIGRWLLWNVNRKSWVPGWMA